jgi:hypothetical protein
MTAVYLLLAPQVSGDKDSSEFVLVLAFNGVAHPTGYPIFCLLGHLWARGVHALGATWAYAANSWSAVGGGVALVLLHRLGCALLPDASPLGRGRRFLLAALPVAFLALNPIWTYETTLAEVYSWHVAWAMGACLYFVRLTRGLTGRDEWTAHRLHRHAAGWGLVCGLGGAHHATSVLVAAPLSVVLLVTMIRQRRFTPVQPLITVAAALIPLSSYGILYWRATHPAIVQWPVLTPGLDGLFFHITGQQYRRNLGRFAPSREQLQLLGWYVWPFLAPGLALLGTQALLARGPATRVASWGLAIAAAIGTAYGFIYGVTDPSSYLLVPLALGLVAAVPLVVRMLAGGPRIRRVAGAVGAALALTAAGLSVPWTRTNAERARLYVSFDRYLGSMWQSIPLDTAFVFWANDMTYKLEERQLLGGEKRALLVYHPLFITQGVLRARFIARHGIDPAAGLSGVDRRALDPGMPDSLAERLVVLVEQHVNRASPIPVVHFDARRGTVRLLVKPGGADRPGDRPTDGTPDESESDHPR